MFSKRIASLVMTAAFAAGTLALNGAETAPGTPPDGTAKNALILCAKGYFDGWLKPVLDRMKLGINLTHYGEVKDSKNWKEKGYIFPKLDELKKYDLVLITGGNLLKDAKTDFLEYMKNGGTVMMLYTSLTITRDKTGELAFGAAGFDGVKALHEVPYTQKVKLDHKLKYTKDMGKDREYTITTVYTVCATDLMDAKPLVVMADKPGLVSACAAPVGKGRFIYSGTGDMTTIADILRACGLAKK